MPTNEDCVKAVNPARALRRDRAALWLGCAVAALGGCGEQPKPNCLTTTAPFAVKLIERERIPSACVQFTPSTFGADPTVGMSAVYERDGKGQPDYFEGSLAIRTAEIGTLLDTAETYGFMNLAPGGQPHSLGKFASGRPDDDDLCKVPELSPTRLVLPALPPVPDDPTTEDEDESFPGQDPVDITLTWSNVQVLVTAASFGTQASAELVDERRAPDGSSCAVRYTAVALAPAVSCQAHDADDELLTNPDGTPQLDPALCDPEANPAMGRFFGSGISPNTKFVCDPVIAHCVIDGESIPALR